MGHIATKSFEGDIHVGDAEHNIAVHIVPTSPHDGDLVLTISLAMRLPDGTIIQRATGTKPLSLIVGNADAGAMYTAEDVEKFKSMIFALGLIIAAENGCTIVPPESPEP